MATNKPAFLRNDIARDTIPHVILGQFQAGATQAIKMGELLKLSGGNWIPLAADESMSAVIAVANEEIKDGDRAGFYEIIVPRPGDVFEFELAAASNPSIGASLYWSSSQKVAVSGSNVLGSVIGQAHYPAHQGHLSEDSAPDAGVTIKNTSYVQMAFKASVSYWAALYL